METNTHWDNIYQTKTANEVSWYCPHLETSLSWIESAVPLRTAAIIDVGAGESTLIDDLLSRGYTNVTILDISQAALTVTLQRLGELAKNVKWVCGDVTKVSLGPSAYDVWHDRAVFHFLTTKDQRRAYVEVVEKVVKPGGHVIVSTFGPEGPTRCSGLPVVRYDAEQLHSEFGSHFRLVESLTESHHTPFGTVQQFLYCHFIFVPN
jgi:2-polyprenyl-3-methyl-5-hydroxy-6-metoxy-1,4-benzoquinol methylase